MSALIVAVAVLGTLWGPSQTASADPDGVALVHVNPDGSDFVGNPYCPQTVWENGVPLSVDPRHDCNNITSQKHVIRTEGFTTGEGEFTIEGVGIILAEGLCNDIPEVASRLAWCDDDSDGVCDEDGDNEGVDDDGDTLIDEDQAAEGVDDDEDGDNEGVDDDDDGDGLAA